MHIYMHRFKLNKQDSFLTAFEASWTESLSQAARLREARGLASWQPSSSAHTSQAQLARSILLGAH